MNFCQRFRHGNVIIHGFLKSRGPLTLLHALKLGHKFLDAAVPHSGLGERSLGVFEHGTVVRGAQVVAQLYWADNLQHVGDREHVAQGLRHFLTGHGDPVVVHPVVGKLVTSCMGLGNLVLVVRELQIEAAAVNIKLAAQVVGGHSRALQVPAGAAPTPRGGPGRLARLGGLPQRKILRAALTFGFRLALLHILDAITGQRTVIRTFGDIPCGDVEINRAGGVFSCGATRHGRRIAGVDKPRHVLHHLRDKARRARLHRGWEHTEGVVGLGELALVGGYPLPPRAVVFCGLGQNLVINVRHIAHECHVIALGQKPTAQNVEGHAGAQVADMRLGLWGGTTQINRGMAGTNRLKVTLGAGGGVKNAQSTHSA